MSFLSSKEAKMALLKAAKELIEADKDLLPAADFASR
jgi:hypothetical protein